MFKFTAPVPLSLYIHLPWCVKKCPYCDFNSHEARDSFPEALYINALLKDLDQQFPNVEERRLVSIFFGGGTPSLFSPCAIEKILKGIDARFHFDSNIEITLEANPGTVDEARFKNFRAAGINRLSIGIQSLQDEKLKALGRIHLRDHALSAIDAAINAGFDNYNLDFMHGLPGQSITDALADLTDALTFNPPHLSWYQLTLEPNTLFAHNPPLLPNEDLCWEIQEQGKQLIADAHLKQYEVSAYARAGHECVHNRHYWEFGDYLGIGAGAHSKITDEKQGLIIRDWQIKHPKEYLRASATQTFVANRYTLSVEEAPFEFMLNAFRLVEGIPKKLFVERTGLPLSIIESNLTQAINKKLLIVDAEHLLPTALGQRFLNDLISLFMPQTL
jgi:putative oxygen-independent coproporphyrinogen III oxidase